MIPLERISELLDRLRSYDPREVAIELAVIGLVVYLVVRFVQGTRAAGAVKGVLVVLVVGALLARILGGSASFQRLAFLYDRFLAILAITLVVIFQPELRRALIRLGEAPFFRSSPSEIAYVVDAVVDACAYLSKARFGAIIVLQRAVGLQGLVEGGTPLRAEVSSRLLQTIFFPGSALHDLAVVIKGRIVDAAGVQLPMADPSEVPDMRLGARHRAAIGLSRDSDALVVVVSEETGNIRIAERGRLSEPLRPEALKTELLRRLRRELPPAATTAAEEHDQEQAMQVAVDERPTRESLERSREPQKQPTV